MRINFHPDYFKASRSFLYSIIITFPLIVFYEFLNFIDLYKSNTIVINSLDMLSLLSRYFNFEYPDLYKSIFIVTVYFLIIFTFKSKFENNKINIKYSLIMVVESFIYSIFMYLLIKNIARIPLIINYEVKGLS